MYRNSSAIGAFMAVVLTVSLSISVTAQAQVTLTPAFGSTPAGVPMNMSDLPQVREPAAEPVFVPHEYPGDPAIIAELKRNPREPHGRLAKQERDDRSPNATGNGIEGLGTNFQGISYTGSVPPDPVIAVGLNHVVLVVNDAIGIYTKAGSLVSQTTFFNWFSNVIPPVGLRLFDPKVIYDHHANRWIVLALLYRLAPPDSFSSYLISASQTSDPTGSWYNYNSNARLNGTQNTPLWADFPGLGFDNDAAYVTSNQINFGGGGYYAKLRIFNKSQLYAGQTLTYTDFWNMRDANDAVVFTLKPAHHFGTPSSRYLVNTNFGGGDYLTLWRVDNPIGGSPTLTQQATVSVGSYSIPPNAVQQGSSNLIETGYCDTQDAIYRDGYIYATFSTAYNWGSGTVSAVRYSKINVSTNVAALDVIYGDDGLYYYYPAIYTDAAGNLVLVFSRSGVTEYAGVRYAYRYHFDGATRASENLKSGEGPYSIVVQGRNRWGDYSGIALDPTDDRLIWFYGEWAKNNNQWSTWVGSFKTTIPVTLTNEINSQNAGGSLRIVDVADVPSGQPFDLPINTSQTARTLNERFPNWQGSGITYKHHHWNSDLAEYRLNHDFTVSSGAAQNQKAIFTRLDPITVNASLVEGGTGGQIQFRDPWWVDENGNQPNIYRTFTSPMDSGMFLSQFYGGANPYYSVGAPSPQTINGFNYNFLNWTTTGGSASFENANSVQTGVVFNQANTIVSANYKAYFGSSTTNALSNSSQRKIIRDGNGYLFACYESGGHIWLSRSTDNGVTWGNEKRMSDDVPGFTNRSPCVSRTYLAINNKVLVAWEAFGYSGGNYVNKVYLRAIDPITFSSVVHMYMYQTQSPYPFTSAPVLAPSFGLYTIPTLFAWFDPSGPSIRGRVVDYPQGPVALFQGNVTSSFTLAANDMNEGPYWLNPTWKLAWSAGSTLYSGACYLNSSNQLVPIYSEVVTENGGGVGELSMVYYTPASVSRLPAVAWVDNGLASGPGCASSYSVRYRERSSAGWNTPITTWADVYCGVSSPSLTYNYATNTVSLMWQGGSAIRNSKKTGGSWTAVTTVANGVTPSISISVPGNVQNPSEMLLSRSVSGSPYSVQRTPISFGAEEEEGDRIASLNKGEGAFLGPNADSTVAEGRGGRIVFANGEMHIVILSASLDGQPLRFPTISDTLHVLRRQQIDSAATTLPFVGVGILDLKVLYRTSGVVPNAAQFGLEARDANTSALLGKLRAFANVGDTILTLHVPVNFPGRTITVGLAASNMNGVRAFTLERWFLPSEEFNAPVAGLSKTQHTSERPTEFALHQNYPNPFNPTTQIRFDLPVAGNVSLAIYDVLGREVAKLVSGYREAGYHSTTWVASEQASGVYFARFTSSDPTGRVVFSKLSKLMLVK